MKPSSTSVCAAAAAALVLLAGCASQRLSGVEMSPSAQPVRVFAAGSLRESLSTIASEHEARTGQKLELSFGASGLLRERLEKGEAADVFASADTGHPARLAAAGLWQPPTVFVRSSLCALTRADLQTSPASLLATLLQPGVRVGTSTPVADPSGDYAWALFRKADALRPGSYALLDAKALKLVGAADSPRPPAGRATYPWLMDEGRADIFLTYCTNAVAAQQESPRLLVVQIPPELQVGAQYGVTVRLGASGAAAAFAQSLLAAPAQAVFQRHGLGRP